MSEDKSKERLLKQCKVIKISDYPYMKVHDNEDVIDMKDLVSYICKNINTNKIKEGIELHKLVEEVLDLEMEYLNSKGLIDYE